MEVQYRKEYSPALGRDMECKIYGHKGRPVLFIPCQDGRFFDFENFHMTDTWSPWLEAGEVMVFSIDTIDQETWSDTDGDPYWRIRRYEQWLQYVTMDEPASDRLLNASAVIAMDLLMVPAINFPVNNNTFSKIPTIPHKIP